MGRQLDDGASALLKKIAEEQGIQIRLNAKISAVEGDTSAAGVRMDDGEVIPAELVIISAGVRANTAVADGAGIKIDRSVVVNEKWRQVKRISMPAATVPSSRVSIMPSGPRLLRWVR